MSHHEAHISIYVTENRKNEIKQRADDEDTTMSKIVNEMIDYYLQHKAQDAVASEAHVEERIQELMTVGTETMTETAEEIRNLNARIGTYVIANFMLQGQQWSNHVQKEALKSGRRRIYQNFDTHVKELEERSQSTETESEATVASASEQHQSPSETSSTSNIDSRKTAAENEGSREDTNNTDDDISGSDLFDQLRKDQG